jgi:hypothetical protein
MYVYNTVRICSTVWHPWQKYLVYKMEQVQRSAARYVFKYNDYNYTSSVSKMVKKVNRKKNIFISLKNILKAIHVCA